MIDCFRKYFNLYFYFEMLLKVDVKIFVGKMNNVVGIFNELMEEFEVIFVVKLGFERFEVVFSLVELKYRVVKK